jgi:hypothetical protein
MSVATAYQGPDSDLAPDPVQIGDFCRWWFEKTNRGVLEIGWLDSGGRGLIHFEQFARDDIDALVSAAVQANLAPGQACYIRAATVMAWGNGPRRTTDMDFEQAPGIWSDIDKEEDFERARTIQTMVRPNASVITGTIPSIRVQSWFRCSEPIVAPDLVRSLNVRLHKLYGGDPAVVNPSRLMRLPGTIAWPWKAGRQAELVRFVRPAPDDPRPSSYPISLLTSQLPAGDEPEQQRPQVATPQTFGLGGLSTVSGLIAAIRSGREWHNHMIQLVAHWVGQGRSSAEIMGHCEGWTLAGFSHDETRREVAKAIDGARQKWNSPDVDPSIGPAEPTRPDILSLADLDALPAPVWLVHGLVPERSLVVPYGPPKAGKTFVILSLGLHIAAGREWFGHAVQQGAVVYIAGEGVGGMSLRMKAMRARYGIAIDVPFWVIPRAVNLRVPAAVNALEATIRATIGPLQLRLLVVDTLARAMPGADENSAQEVGSVIAAADYLKDALRCTTALVHHEGKDGERGARGTSALRGAWDAAYQITGSGGRAKMTVVDQKDAEAGQVLSFIMEQVQVTIGRSSLVPVLDEAPGADRDPHHAGGQTGIALQVLHDALAGSEAAIVPWSADMPEGETSGLHIETWRRKFYEKMPTVSQEARKKAFQRSVENLTRSRAIGVRDPWVWLG